MKRRESREIAFILLFEWTFREDETLDEIIEMAEKCREAKCDDFARKLAAKTIERRIKLDYFIQTHSDKWKLNRLSRVTLTVLRMSVCELSTMNDIPAGATINEAVELMKKYATEDEAAYVNGVLGAFYRSCEAGQAAEVETAATVEPQPEEV